MSITVRFPDGIDIVEAGARIGDAVRFTGATVAEVFEAPNSAFDGDLRLTSILSKDSFTYEGYKADGTVANLVEKASFVDGLIYSIVHLYTKDEQAQLIADLAKSLDSKRTILNWPPAGEVDFVDEAGVKQTVEVDGTYISACFAAAKSANPAQQGFTNFEIPGPTRLKYSNDYFNPRQLKVMSAAGVNVFVQDVEGGKMYLLHQRTTDISMFENSEISMVNVEDKVALDLIATLRPFKGKYNITDNYLTFLQDLCEKYLYKAKNNNAPMCGPLILNGKVVSIRANLHGKNKDLGDGEVEITISIERGKPANWINIKLLV